MGLTLYEFLVPDGAPRRSVWLASVMGLAGGFTEGARTRGVYCRGDESSSGDYQWIAVACTPDVAARLAGDAKELMMQKTVMYRALPGEVFVS